MVIFSKTSSSLFALLLLIAIVSKTGVAEESEQNEPSSSQKPEIRGPPAEPQRKKGENGTSGPEVKTDENRRILRPVRPSRERPIRHWTPGPSGIGAIRQGPRGLPGLRGPPGRNCDPEQCKSVTEAEIENICDRIVQRKISEYRANEQHTKPSNN